MTDRPHSDIILKVYNDIPVDFLLEAIDGALVNAGADDYTSVSREFGQYDEGGK